MDVFSNRVGHLAAPRRVKALIIVVEREEQSQEQKFTKRLRIGEYRCNCFLESIMSFLRITFHVSRFEQILKQQVATHAILSLFR